MTALDVLIVEGFQHPEAIVQAAQEVGLPLHVGVAMIEKESRGANVYGNDRGGVFAVGDPARPADGRVTAENYAEFERRVLAGETSNGVGPAQITHPSFIKDAKDRGIPLWQPLDNIKYGFALLKTYLNGQETDEAIRRAGTRYNGAAVYGDDLLAKARKWEERLLAKNHTVAEVAALEAELRRRGYDITCGPTDYKNGRCPSHGNTWPHLKNSTHTIGGAIDVSKDPKPGVAISTFEKAHLDDLARELMSRGWRVIWGVANHYDHLHVDFNLYGAGGGHQVTFQGPNAGFTVAQILKVQTDLKTLGYYTGALDGLREANTIKAIKAFQKAAGLTQDGLPGKQTQAKIAEALKAKANPPKPTTPPLAERLKKYRIYGADAYATAVALDKATLPSGKGVLLAGRGGPDHVAAGVKARTRSDVHVLPVPSGGALPSAITARIKELKPAWVRAVGGSVAVSDKALEAALAAAGIRV